VPWWGDGGEKGRKERGKRGGKKGKKEGRKKGRKKGRKISGHGDHGVPRRARRRFLGRFAARRLTFAAKPPESYFLRELRGTP
jgi:hypothetical protein